MPLLILCERGLRSEGPTKKEAANFNQLILEFWTKDMLFWERGSVFVLRGKEKRLWIPSKVIWIRYDRQRSCKDVYYRQEREILEDQTEQVT